MCIDRAGIVGNDGETHQGLYDMSFLRLIPNITIAAPKNFEELCLMLDFAVSFGKPIAIRYPRGGESKIKMSCKKIHHGKCEIMNNGDDLTIIAIGNMVARAIEVANMLSLDGISCDVINARFLKPFDSKRIMNSIIKTKKVVTIEDGTIIGGLSSAVKELLFNNEYNDVKIKSYAYPDRFIKQGTVSEIEKKYNLDTLSIYNDIKRFL